MERLEHLDELLAEAVLERHALAGDLAWDQHDLLVLDVDAFDRADALGEHEHLGLRERRRGVEAALALPDQGRVQALLDRRPDRERGRELVALHDEVRAVAHAHLGDLVEQLLGGVAGEDVREARLHADADEREQTRPLPLLVAGELAIAEHLAGQLVGPLRVRVGERHGHVQVGHAGLEGGVEDRLVEARVARVEHRVGPHAGHQLDELRDARGVDPLGAEALALAEPLARPPRRAPEPRRRGPPPRRPRAAARSPRTPRPRLPLPRRVPSSTPV